MQDGQNYRSAQGVGTGWVQADLLAVLAYVVLADAVFLTGSHSQLATVVLGLPLVGFLPGYVLVATLFPRAVAARATEEADAAAAGWLADPIGHRGLSGFERFALSIGASVALLPVLGLAVAVLPVALSASTLLGALTVFVFAGAIAGVVRRLQVPADERYRFDLAGRAAAFRSWLVGDGLVDLGVNLALSIAILVAFSAMAYAVAVPGDSNAYTTFYVGTPNGTDQSGGSVSPSELTACGYPTNLSVGDSARLVTVVENHEGQSAEYTMVATLDHVRTDGNDTTVTDSREIVRRQATLQPGQEWLVPHDIRPRRAGDNVRVSYYLYRSNAPSDPSADSAYRNLRLWLNVTGPGNATAG
ncbi:MAG: DUF1616 domain-containing protein [Haloarculaceae archaeon]